jgi:hypothetical protein
MINKKDKKKKKINPKNPLKIYFDKIKSLIRVHKKNLIKSLIKSLIKTI